MSKPEQAERKLGRLEERRVRRQVSGIAAALADVAIPELRRAADIKSCVRPHRELRVAEDEARRQYGSGWSRKGIIPRSNISIVKAAAEVGLYYGSAHFLEHRSHRLIIGEDANDISYHREPFAVDCQMVGSRTLNLSGIAEVGLSPDARIELDWLHQELTRAHVLVLEPAKNLSVIPCS